MILLVSEDKEVGQFLDEFLKVQQYRYVCADSLKTVAKNLKNHTFDISIIFCNCNNDHYIQLLNKLSPNSELIIITDVEEKLHKDNTPANHYYFLKKNIKFKLLASKLKELCAK